MSGYFYRLKPVDFRLRTELGAVKGANVADWPITYEDLAPFYDKAEEELGVSGNAVPAPVPRAAQEATTRCRRSTSTRSRKEIDKACQALG